jgi:hypothetical protein
MSFKIVGSSTESTLNIEFAAGGGGSFAVDADATPVLTISFAGAVFATITNASHPSLGTYVATWVPTQSGQYDLAWTFNVSGAPYTVDDTVFALQPSSLASTSGGFVTVTTTTNPFSANLVQGEFTYRSGNPPNIYQFTIVYDFTGQISVRQIENPYGQIVSPYTKIPKSVSDDIASAMEQVENILGLTSALNGTVTFSSDNTKSVLFSTPLANDSYRVQITSDIFAPFRVSVKSKMGFTIEAGATITGLVDFDIFL